MNDPLGDKMSTANLGDRNASKSLSDSDRIYSIIHSSNDKGWSG